jgi:hypothetical protein
MMSIIEEPVGAAEFYEAYGRLVASMARLENLLTEKLSVLVEQQGSAKTIILGNRAHGAKSDFDALIECFSDIPELQPHLTAAQRFREQIEHMFTVRNLLIHGHFWVFSNSDPVTARFVKTQVRRDALHGSEAEWSVSNLKDMERLTDELTGDLNELSRSFSNLSEPSGN